MKPLSFEDGFFINLWRAYCDESRFVK